MRNKKFSLLVAVCLLVVVVAVGCKDDVTKPKEKSSLVGTKWKLVGFYDVEKKELTEVEQQKGCEECYTLNFDTDSTASGMVMIVVDLVWNYFGLYLSDDNHSLFTPYA